MFKKSLPAMALVFIILSGGCKTKTDYSDVKEFINEMIKYQENQVNSLEKAKNGKEIAEAINKNKKIFTSMIIKGRKIEAKYPELKEKNKLPEELKPHFAKMEEISKVYVQVTGKIMEKYAKDPDVMKALK